MTFRTPFAGFQKALQGSFDSLLKVFLTAVIDYLVGLILHKGLLKFFWRPLNCLFLVLKMPFEGLSNAFQTCLFKLSKGLIYAFYTPFEGSLEFFVLLGVSMPL